MNSWLTKLGQRILSVESAEQGLELLQKEHPDLVIVDFRLPGLNGIEMIRHLSQSNPQTQCVLATDWASIHGNIDEVEQLEHIGVGVMIKPIMPEDLADVLLSIKANPIKSVEKLHNNLILPDLDAITSLDSMISVLKKCCLVTQFDYAVLFSLDTAARKIEVTALTPNAVLNLDVIDDLIHSPVRDVAEDGMTVSETSLTPNVSKARYQFLQKFCRFSACLGVPVKKSFHHEYALFLFSRSTRDIQRDHLSYAEASAIILEALLEKQIFHEKARALHRVALLGQMASNFVHEINHSLSLLDPQLDVLESILEHINNKIQAGSVVSQADVLQATSNLKQARQSLGALYAVTRLMSTPFTRKRDEYIRLDELVEMSSLLLQELSKRSRVSIQLVSPKKLLFMRAKSSLLLQVLWNLLLNAMEQISELRREEGGHIQVRIEGVAANREDPRLQILVEDNGPGIHNYLWNRVFEAGYSTREGGSGLGLYISQGIIRSMGGSLYIQESFLLGGTTFVIDLPHHV
jgi:signal transduction histidine kinase